MEKSADAFRTISEVADDLILPQHVLRFWETRFPQIRPLKRAGGRRYYRPADIVLLKTIRQLLYDDGYTIKGVQRLLKEQGAKGLNANVVPLALVGTETATPRAVANDHEPDDLDDSSATEMSPLPESAIESRDDGSALDPAQLDAIHEALVTIEECLRILAAAQSSS